MSVYPTAPETVSPPPTLLHRDTCALVVVDVQESLVNAMATSGPLVDNVFRLCTAAQLLNIPILATTQNAERLGPIVSALRDLLSAPVPIFDKMDFSSARVPAFRDALNATNRRQVLVCGVETHICVTQTAHDLLTAGFAVHVAPDAVSSRTIERHKLGMERLRDFGVLPCATEAAIFEWLGTANDPSFRAILKHVK